MGVLQAIFVGVIVAVIVAAIGASTKLGQAKIAQWRNPDAPTDEAPTLRAKVWRDSTTAYVKVRNKGESDDFRATVVDLRGAIAPLDAQVELRWQNYTDQLKFIASGDAASIEIGRTNPWKVPDILRTFYLARPGNLGVLPEVPVKIASGDDPHLTVTLRVEGVDTGARLEVVVKVGIEDDARPWIRR